MIRHQIKQTRYQSVHWGTIKARRLTLFPAITSVPIIIRENMTNVSNNFKTPNQKPSFLILVKYPDMKTNYCCQ